MYVRFSKFLLVIFLLLFTACKSAPSVQQPTQQADQAYPASDTELPLTASAVPMQMATDQNQSSGAYPEPPQELAPSLSAYPAPTERNSPPVPVVPFRLNKPVLDSATEVSGTGPAGVPVLIADVTFYGDLLGEGSIASDGTFVVQLSNPALKDHKIGIALADLTGTSWIIDDFSDPGFFGDEPLQVPVVGFFYDTTMVQGE